MTKQNRHASLKYLSLSSLTLFITVIHFWMSVYPYFNRMRCVRFFFTLLYTYFRFMCYRTKIITTINYLPSFSHWLISETDFLLFRAISSHWTGNICTPLVGLYTFTPFNWWILFGKKCRTSMSRECGNSHRTLYTALSPSALFYRS